MTSSAWAVSPTAPNSAVAIIKSDTEAIDAAHALAAWLAPGAAERDARGAIPTEALERFRQSGLLGIIVPKPYGGARVSAQTVARVFAILAAADPAVTQVAQNHFCFVESLVLDGTEQQKEFFFKQFLKGARLGNALSERDSKNVFAMGTRLTQDERGYRLNGTKYYCTGALTADYIPVFAFDQDEHLVIAYVDRDSPGLTAEQDWHAMGQRATVSGTVRLVDVPVPKERILPHYRAYEKPQVFGAFGQIIHAAIDVGIARGALTEGAEFVRTKTRAWFESPSERAADEPLVIHRFGELDAKVRAAEALLFEAGRAIDRAGAPPTVASAAEASLSVAAAKAFAGDVSLEVSNEIFSLTGTRGADDRVNLHRHWRNARTHTLHDPNRWKYHHLGNAVLNGINPPNHALI